MANRVLIVDDQENIRQMTRLALEAGNDKLTLKGVEREALERAARKEMGNEQTRSDH
jgi:CheY-like chemotaxis protein